MAVTNDQMKLLAIYVKQAIIEGFKRVHLSGNLMDTITVRATPEGVDVEIPAEIYDMKKYQKEGVITYTGEGSYASQLDIEGSQFWSYSKNGKKVWKAPRNHIGYVEEAIRSAIARWMADTGQKGSVSYL